MYNRLYTFLCKNNILYEKTIRFSNSPFNRSRHNTITLILYVALSDDLSAALTLPFLRRFIVELARHFKRRSLSLQFLAHFAHKQTR